MYGHNDDIGLLRKCVGFLLQSSHKISVQIVEVYDNKIFDCLETNKADVTSSNGKKASNVAVVSLNQFNELLEGAIQRRIQKATNQNKTSSRSHAITKICLDGLQGCLLFGDLAGFESIEDKENRRETVFINQSLLELNKILLAISKNQVPVYTTVLTKFFRQQFSNGDIIMLYHLIAKSKASAINGLGYIKELTFAKAGKSTIVKTNSQLNKPPATPTMQTNRRDAAKRLSALHSRIARYKPIR